MRYNQRPRAPVWGCGLIIVIGEALLVGLTVASAFYLLPLAIGRCISMPDDDHHDHDDDHDDTHRSRRLSTLLGHGVGGWLDGGRASSSRALMATDRSYRSYLCGAGEVCPTAHGITSSRNTTSRGIHAATAWHHDSRARVEG